MRIQVIKGSKSASQKLAERYILLHSGSHNSGRVIEDTREETFAPNLPAQIGY